MKDYTNEEKNNFNEKTNFSLIQRKNKINFILFKGRKLSEIKNKKALDLFNDNDNIITIENIKSKLNDILLIQNLTEKKFLNILNDIIDNLETFINNNNIETINLELIESSVIEKMYNNLTLNSYINNEEISLNVLILFSIIIFIYNRAYSLELYKNKFISEDKYIYLLSSLLNNNTNEEFIYNVYRFIGLLTQEDEDISNKLYNYNILEQIIDNNEFDKNIEFIQIKLYCISNFELKLKYKNNPKLSLKIQKLYIFIFNEYILNKDYEEDFFYNFAKIIGNLSFCLDEIYIKNLLDSNIIAFLINFDKNNNTITNDILKIIGNMSSISNEILLNQLYKFVIQYLLNVISNNKFDNFIIGLALWTINNFSENFDLCYDIFFNNDLISVYEDYILNQKIIDEDIFKEICLSYKNLIFCIIEFKNYYLLKKINLIPKLIELFKKIKDNNLNETMKNLIEVLVPLFNINQEISDFNKYIFLKNGGVEYIFERINNTFLEDNKNKNDDNENVLLNCIDILKKQILNN